MIYRNKITPDKATTKMSMGGLFHYLPQTPYKVVDKFRYTLLAGETVYSLAVRIFGENQSYFWTIIADLNPLMPVETWKSGDVIWLPKQIVEKRNG